MQSPGPISPDGKWWWNGAQWVPYQAPPPVVVGWPYQSASYRARVTAVLLMTTIGGYLLFTLSAVVSDLFPNPNDSQALAVGLIAVVGLLAWSGTLVPTIVFFCMWLHRVVRNMPAVGSPDPRWSPARAVVYCFIPILNLVHPLWSVLDAWRGADPSRRWLERTVRKTLGAPRIITVWWALWLIGSYAFNISSRLSGTPAVVLDLIAGASSAGAAIFAIRVVNEVTARQERKQELISTGQLA